jgi:PRTRC genetic system protein C
MTTIYEYDGKELFKDEEDAYTPDEIQAHYSQHFKELVQATYTVVKPEKEGDPRTVIFAKKVGTKGQRPAQAPIQDPDQSFVIERLLALEPKPFYPLELLHQIYADGMPADAQALLALGPQVERAMSQAITQSNRCARIIEQCLKLQPVPSTRPPHGF